VRKVPRGTHRGHEPQDGIGVQPPTPSWGNILTSGKDYIEFAWWLSLFPGLAILVTVLAYNLLGEGIRDALDPRVKR